MSRKAQHEPEDIKVKDMIDNVYSFIEYKIKKCGILFINSLPSDLTLTIDIHDFQQLFLNLFINAVHSMQEGGILEIKGSREDSNIFIEVLDNGCGIEAEHIGKIFDPFFTTKPTGEGTGLGLWLTYEIIRNYNGEISVESEVNKGTRFILKFPSEHSLHTL